MGYLVVQLVIPYRRLQRQMGRRL